MTATPSAPRLGSAPGPAGTTPDDLLLDDLSRPRAARPRRYLMCPPEHFALDYAINPWMTAGDAVDVARATAQWQALRDTYTALGHEVHVIDAVPGLPDMVFAANGGLVVDGLVMPARFRHAERVGEGPVYREWFRRNGFTPLDSPHVSEGEGDFLVVGRYVLAGTGFRTHHEAHDDAQELLGRPVVTLRLVDPRFYHLDTALAVLDDETVAYYPPAFSPGSLAALRLLFPDAVVAAEADAMVLGLNAVSDGRHVVLPGTATGLAAQVAARGFVPVPVDLSELRKAGGGPKCCTLELR
ncbi:dimethylargininase [Kineosporia sp. A_224]|uniref:dimethylargininase n=1 Tax=Kineosporia sp. A_224 TaxID=1962180 RepID=UPI000B4AC5E8|nr:dimethylargininase [Kineosporia sp. A_224]